MNGGSVRDLPCQEVLIKVIVQLLASFTLPYFSVFHIII